MSRSCCDGYRRAESHRRGCSRRVFLQAGGSTLFAWGHVPAALARLLVAAGHADGRVLVCLFLRGAVDGLSLLVPHGESTYYEERPRIAIPPPGGAAGRTIDLDGRFGLHPALTQLAGWYRSGELALVHAVGSPNPSRSHFAAQDAMEAGSDGLVRADDGWLDRLLSLMQPPARPSALRALATTSRLPRSLVGVHGALAVGDLEAFLAAGDGRQRRRRIDGGRGRPRLRAGLLEQGFAHLYGAPGRDLVARAGRSALTARELLRAADPLGYRPRVGVRYPDSELGRQLRQIAQLIRAEVGLQVAFAEAGGWDTHADQGAGEGQLAARLADLGAALAAFAGDLEERMDRLLLLTLSEFGRTVAENGSGGTDHGHGTVSLVLGGGVRGGRLFGRWPGLERERRFEGRDLAVTTDYRDLLTEIAAAHLRPRALDGLFPGHRLAPERRLGLFA